MDKTTHKNLVLQATKHIKDIVTISIGHKEGEKALVVYDTNNGLTKILTESYRTVLPHARFIDFDTTDKDAIVSAFDDMKEHDLVVLIQTSNFLLNAFRIRLHLFNKKLKVIEHVHLYRNSVDVWDVYINSLAYDTSWYRVVGPNLKAKLEHTQKLVIKSGTCQLIVTDGLESPKLNIGDYTGMENIGGTFPIGEVFTEAKTLESMSGSCMIYAYADSNFDVQIKTPFKVDIEHGLITQFDTNAPESFKEIVAMVKEVERPLIREIGFGLNRAITKERYLEDITAFERILGMHLSFGEKHGTYKKEGIPIQKSKYHIDLFPVVDEVLADGIPIFKDGKYLV